VTIRETPKTDLRDPARQSVNQSKVTGDLGLLRRIMVQAMPQWRLVFGLVLLNLLAVPIALATPLPLVLVADSVVGGQPIELFQRIAPQVAWEPRAVLLLAVGLVLVIAMAKHAQAEAAELLRVYVGERLALAFRAELFRHVQRMSLSYHDSQGTTQSAYRIHYDAPSVHWITVDALPPLISSTITLACMIWITSRINWQLALVALAVSPALLLLSAMYGRRLRERWHLVKEQETSALAIVHEVLSAVRLVKAFAQEEREQKRFVDQAHASMRANIRVSADQGLYGLLIGMTTSVGMAAVLYLGATLVLDGTLTFGALLLVMGYLALIYEPLQTISKQAGSVQGALASADRAFSLLDQHSDIRERPHARPISRARGDLRLDNVWFAYPEGPPVLQGVSLEIPAGTSLGIAGPTGTGKTTLISLLSRFYDPTDGRIFFDNIDLRDIRIRDLRNQFGYVLQESVLFSSTIAENIAYARPGASEFEIIAAAKAANVHEFVSRLPDGYRTRVGDRGMMLSQGERQRISLARAFLRDSPVLILDEPTSSLDVNTEASIMDALERLMIGRTTIMIAHRLKTLDYCDVKVELRDGKVHQSGPAEWLTTSVLTGAAATS
jgi:ATP-binding cassette, subfamily B, bacterial